MFTSDENVRRMGERLLNTQALAQRVAVKEILAEGELSGRLLWRRLQRAGFKLSGPAFYGLMAKMEEEGIVRGWYIEKEVTGESVRERRYAIGGT